MKQRLPTALVAVGLTGALALVLIAMAALSAPWLGFVAIALFFVVLLAREATIWGTRSLLVAVGVFCAVMTLGYLAMELR